ncbi:MAG: iron export ABC transporter permease subunit FetB [bacterium]
MTSPTIVDALLALVLVVVSIGITRWWRIPVAREMALGSVRTFIQLIAVGYALELIFSLESLWLMGVVMMVMIVVGAQAASGRIKKLSGAFPVTLVAMVIGSLFTLATMLLLDIIPLQSRYVIPLAGMIISNSMNASALSIDRLMSDVVDNRLAIETALALGKDWPTASGRFRRQAITTGMISTLNFMKTVGIVALPGAMTGMILGGAEPLEAVLLQVIVAYMLLSAVTITSVVAVQLAVRQLFTTRHQLR